MPRAVALIAGPTSGLGAGYAQRCAADGYDLVLVARDARRATELGDGGGRVVEVLRADLADAGDRLTAGSRLMPRTLAWVMTNMFGQSRGRN